jgi:hypothetical protein
MEECVIKEEKGSISEIIVVTTKNKRIQRGRVWHVLGVFLWLPHEMREVL